MSDEQHVTFEINGREISAPKGTMLIDIADEHHIQIPRFCYHKKLSTAANCRMCLVEIERSPKPMPACATPVCENMKVWTRSEKAKAAQADVMEFLLINHPLDCPICDQGGECELQDVSVGYGSSNSQFVEMKRVVKDKDIGSLIETEMTRCIHCTRCVRFGEEIAGMRELGATGRSEHMEIGTYVAKTVSSELSGNVIDLCPVGALTAKPSRYKARAWEMQSHDSVAMHDAVGSNVHVHTFQGEVVRVVPRDNEAVNECWIADRDRFSYQGLTHADRITQPQIKVDGKWQTVDWQEALKAVAAILKNTKSEQVGALANSNSTLEELFLFQQIMRGVGVANIDSRLRQIDFSTQQHIPQPALNMSLPELEQQTAILLVGSNARQDMPMLNHRIRKASLAGAQVMALNPREVAFNYDVEQTAVLPAQMVDTLAAVVKAAVKLAGKSLSAPVSACCDAVNVSETDQQMAQQLLDADNATVLLGAMAVQHPEYGTLHALSDALAEITGANLGVLPDTANAQGAYLAGVLPFRGFAGDAVPEGLHASAMMTQSLSAYVLMNTELADFANPYQAHKALSAANDVVVIAPFADAAMRECATVLLPGSTSFETAGTTVNVAGEWQSFQGVTAPPGEARPSWKVLRVLGNTLGLRGFDYVNARQIAAEMKLDLMGIKPHVQTKPNTLHRTTWAEGLQRVGDVQMYQSDMLVRRGEALQAMVAESCVVLHPAQMADLGLAEHERVAVAQGDAKVTLPVKADASVLPGTAWLPSGSAASTRLASAFGAITVTKAGGA